MDLKEVNDKFCTLLNIPNIDLSTPSNIVEILKVANDVLGRVEFCTAYTGNGYKLFEEQLLTKYLIEAYHNEEFRNALKKNVLWVSKAKG